MNSMIHEEDTYSLCVGDLMAALLLIFVLLLSATLLQQRTDFEKRQEEQRRDYERRKKDVERRERAAVAVTRIAATYHHLQEELFDDLLAEFRDDLEGWGAVLDRKNLSLTFQEPEVLFKAGQDVVSDRFKEILESFFPRYIKCLSDEKYRDSIEEIRIEGHTSSEWGSRQILSAEQRYMNNMELSQKRTRSVLEFCLSCIRADSMRYSWSQARITANGLSSSKLILTDGQEDRLASRRVEFRIRTNAEAKIGDILGIQPREGGQ